MTSHESDSAPSDFWRRLKHAGIDPGDSEELRLNKSLLMLATGLVNVGIISVSYTHLRGIQAGEVHGEFECWYKGAMLGGTSVRVNAE